MDVLPDFIVQVSKIQNLAELWEFYLSLPLWGQILFGASAFSISFFILVAIFAFIPFERR